MVYLFLADGFEEIEALSCVDILRRAGIEILTAGVTGKIVAGAHGINVEADLLIESAQTEGFESVTDYGVTVVLDTTLTPELVEEGNANEIISKIQTMRKDADFEVMDHIKVAVVGNDLLAQVVKNNEKMIGDKVLAASFSFTDEYAVKKEWNVNGENVTISIEKV